MSFAQRRSGFFKSSLTGSLPSLAGNLAVTLDNVTATATGTVDIAGALSQTLANVTSSAAGALAITGTLTQTLQDVTLSAAGTVGSGITGDLAVTLDNVTLSSAGAVAIAGTTSSTLANVTLSAASTLTISGALASTLANVTVSAAGSVAITGALSKTLADDTLVSEGTGGILGQLSATLSDVTLSAAGELGAAPTPSTGVGGSGGGGAIWYQGKRRKLPELNKQLNEILDAAAAEVLYKDVIQTDSPQAEQAAKVVRPYSEQKQATIPTPESVDWKAIERDVTRARRLLTLWQQLERKRSLDAEDEDWFFLN